MKNVILFLLIACFFGSCSVNENIVGKGPKSSIGDTKLYSHERQLYLLNGLIRLNKAKPELPEDGNYLIRTSHNVVDALIASFTFAIITSRTVKIYVIWVPPPPKAKKKDGQ